MTSPILTSTYNYDNSAQRWRNSTDGRFVSHSSVVDEMRVHQQATYAALEGATRQLYAGRINVAQWQLITAQEIKDAHLAQGIFGAGGRANMDFAAWGRVGQTLREQYGFLDNFARQIAAGQITEAQALARIKMYGNASQQSYWAERTERSTGQITWKISPAENCSGCLGNLAGNPYTKATLPNYPGDGSTQCKANCKCYLEFD